MDYLDSLRSDSGRFVALLAALDPGGGVPACPEWTVDDLVWHLTEVQWFWGSIVSGRLSAPDRAREGAPTRPSSHGALIDRCREASDRLVEALAAAAEDEPVWTWHQPDQSVGFVLRRQAHEALIHRIDAELASGVTPAAIAVDMAADGVDEMLDVVLGTVPSWGHFEPDGDAIRVHASDADRRWGVAFGRFCGTSPDTGTTHDLPAVSVGLDAVDAVTAVAGPAADLDLWLWGRSGLDRLTLSGETRLVDRLRSLAIEAGQ